MDLISRPEGFNSVHLPLVYKIENDKFPTNTVDSVVNVTADSDWGNGYYFIECDNDIKTGIEVLDYLLVEVNGVKNVYQILDVTSDYQVVISLQYIYGVVNSFGTVQFYYQNYHNKINIYAGLRSGHALNADKPNKLITTLSIVPGTDNISSVNINEIIKTDIGILTNNLTLSTLQNDIDAFTEFYIDYAECYDISNGLNISTYTSTYSSESSNYAIAVNSKLPFRNGNGGKMTDYESGNKFLTLFQKPVLFSGNYFDVFFLKGISDSDDITAERYKNGVLVDSGTISVDDKDEGVYRVSVDLLSDEDKINLSIGGGQILSIDVDYTCYNQSIYLTWLNYLGGMDYWLFTAEKEYGLDIEDVKQTEENIFINWPDSYNSNRIKYDIQRTSRETILVRSQNLTLDQVQALKYIKTSPLVQIYNDRNVLVDSSSFTVYSESDKLYSIAFTISMTNDVPAQSL